MTKFGRFAIVGGLGFVVDAGFTYTLINQGLDPFTARLIAIPIAMLVCWRLNRAITFGASGTSQHTEGARYAAVAVTSAVFNYAAYSVLMLAFPGLLAPIAVAVATFMSMAFSFTGYQHFAFRKA